MDGLWPIARSEAHSFAVVIVVASIETPIRDNAVQQLAEAAEGCGHPGCARVAPIPASASPLPGRPLRGRASQLSQETLGGVRQDKPG